jgi:hypothetical protein
VEVGGGQAEAACVDVVHLVALHHHAQPHTHTQRPGLLEGVGRLD